MDTLIAALVEKGELERFVAGLKADKLVKHMGPGPHPSGSPQSVHGRGKSGGDSPSYRNDDFTSSVSEVDAAEFYEGFAEAREGKYGAFLSDFTEEDFAADNVRVFTAFDGKVGAALTDHGDGRIEAGSLYALPGSPPAAGRDMLRFLIHEHEANWLNNFDGPLTEFYVAEGFEVETRDPWNEEYAPPDWNYDEFGTPDFVTMGRDRVEKSDGRRGHDQGRRLGADASAAWRRLLGEERRLPGSSVGVPGVDRDDRHRDGPPVTKHASPVHPGTGTDQSVHGGGGTRLGSGNREANRRKFLDRVRRENIEAKREELADADTAQDTRKVREWAYNNWEEALDEGNAEAAGQYERLQSDAEARAKEILGEAGGRDRSAAEGAIKDVESATGRNTGEMVDFRAPGQLADDVTAMEMQDAKDVFEGELFNHSSGETYTAQVNDMFPQRVDGEDHMIVQGDIIWETAPGAGEDGGQITIGSFRRRLQPGGIVYNGSFDISEDHQGQGIGTMFLSHWEDELANAGFTRMDVSAAGVGRYAWAVSGYDWRNFQNEVMSTAKQWVTFYDDGSVDLLPEIIRDDDDSFFELRIFVEDWEDADIYPAPVDLALIGHSRQRDSGDGRPTHFGKEFMLHTNGWGGTKELTVRKSLNDARFVWKAWAENRPAGIENDDPEFLADLADALDGHYPEEEDVEKHADHDQSTHGNWAKGIKTEELVDLPGGGQEGLDVVRIGDEVAGEVTWASSPSGKGLHVSQVDVGSEFRRKGIATAMVRNLIERFPEAEVDLAFFQPDGLNWIRAVGNDLFAGRTVLVDEDVVGQIAPHMPDVDVRIYEGGTLQKSGVLSPGFGSKRKRRNQLVQRLKSTRRYDPPVRGGKKKKRRSSLARNIIRRRKGGKRF